jgi:sulfur dioxygenase
MLLRQLFDHDTWTYTYLLADAGEAVLIDPVVEQVERDLKLIDELGLRLVATLDTHIHADHTTGSGALRDRTGSQSAAAAAADVACVDRHLHHLDRVTFGGAALEVRAPPGHTDTCLTFVARDGERTMAFTGDALLIRGCGRTDFQSGDAATLYRSVHEQIYSLPADTLVYPGHDYRGHTHSTVAEERAHNPRLGDHIDAEAFVALMAELRLAPPKRIHEAVPANLACGKQPLGQSHDAAMA